MSISSESISSSNIHIKTWIPSFEQYTHKNKPQSTYPKSLKPFASIICSSRNQGKSTFLKYLYLNHFKDKFHLVIVFSQTLINGFYDKYIPNTTKYDSYDPKVLENLIDLIDEHKEKTGHFLNSLVIFDDCISEEIKYDEMIQNIYIMGRHRNISICFITQSPTLVKTIWRQNTTHLIVLRLKGLGKKHIIDNFLLDLVDEDDMPDNETNPYKYMSKILKQVHSTQYNALVVEFDLEGSDLSSCISQFKAPI